MEEYEILTKEEFEREHQDAYDCDQNEFDGKSLKEVIKTIIKVFLIIMAVMMLMPIGFGIIRIMITIALISFIGTAIFRALGVR